MALDNLPAFPDDMYDTAHDGAVPQPVTPRKPISPFSFTKHLTRTPVPVAVVRKICLTRTCRSSRRSLPLVS